ncbi:MAG: class I SAM-dependent methyltransferase family protein [Deltaproteobacteria bacterium]
MSTVVKSAPFRHQPPSDPSGPATGTAVSLESPSLRQRAGYLLVNPWKNFLLPAGWLRKRLRRSRSPLVAESFVRPGGWRSMEIIYRNQEPVDWFDRQALRDNPISMAARNRRLIVTQKIAALIARYGRESPVTIVGVGAGPGRHVQTAIVDSGIDPARVRAHLIDLDDDAFEYGRALAARFEIDGCVRFIKGDARRIRETLPDVAAQIVKAVGLVEYLSDTQFVEMFRALRDILVPGGALVTHGLVDAHGTGPFLARMFDLRHKQRTERHMTALLTIAGFRVAECVIEPVGVYPIITAVRDD